MITCEWREYTQWEIIEQIWRERLRGHENYPFRWYHRWFYAFKATVCVILNRRRDMYADPDAVDTVACLNYHGYTTMDSMSTQHDWHEVAVGYGVFKDWYFDMYGTGDF